MHRPQYKIKEVLEKLTGEFDSHDRVEPRERNQSFGTDNFRNQVHQKMKAIKSLIWMNNRSFFDGGILPQNPENFANIPAIKTTMQFTSF